LPSTLNIHNYSTHLLQGISSSAHVMNRCDLVYLSAPRHPRRRALGRSEDAKLGNCGGSEGPGLVVCSGPAPVQVRCLRVRREGRGRGAAWALPRREW